MLLEEAVCEHEQICELWIQQSKRLRRNTEIALHLSSPNLPNLQTFRQCIQCVRCHLKGHVSEFAPRRLCTGATFGHRCWGRGPAARNRHNMSMSQSHVVRLRGGQGSSRPVTTTWPWLHRSCYLYPEQYNVMIWCVWYDMVWYGTIWYDMVWYGMIWCDHYLYCILCRSL